MTLEIPPMADKYVNPGLGYVVVIFVYVGAGTSLTRLALTDAAPQVYPLFAVDTALPLVQPNSPARDEVHKLETSSTTPSMSTVVMDHSYMVVFFLFAA